MMMEIGLKKSLWQEIMELSSAMLYHGERNHWDTVTKLEFSRKKMLTQFFSNHDPLDNNVELFIDVSQLLEFNKKLLDMVRQEKEGCKSTIANLQKGKTALQAYQQVS